HSGCSERFLSTLLRDGGSMIRGTRVVAAAAALALTGVFSVVAWSQDKPARGGAGAAPFDAVNEAQTARDVPRNRPEQKLGPQDDPERLKAANAQPSSTALETQPQKGQVTGFDFYRD